MKGYFKRVQEQTPTRFWINNVTLEQADLAIEAGATGCTQNPAYTWKMIDDAKESVYAFELLDEILKNQPDDNEAQVELQRALVANVAKRFMPMFEKSGGKNGYVSIQGDPFHEDTETIIRHARFNCSAAPNIMAKIPVTEEGLKAIAVLASEGVAINATEVMAVKQAIDVCEVYKKATVGMKNPAPIYFSHIAGIYDEYLQNVVAKEKIDVCPDALYQAGIALAKKAYHMARAICPEMGFIGGGARGLHHFTEMVGAQAAITINWKGTSDKLIELNKPVVQDFLRPVPESVIDELVEKLPDFKKGYFVNEISAHEYEEFGPVVLFRTSFENAWSNALKAIAARRAK